MDNEVDPNSEPSAIIAINIDIIKIKPFGNIIILDLIQISGK